ncbi:MAG: crossover junction endodeoxyribonuclease RuvC [Ktedonobacterales bacterium]|nr:crossover junction endodeoxyribonuclease RuvC [Ktedonobacterales bacterium]
MRVTLGVDPGTATVGYAVVVEEKGKLRLLVCDVVLTPKEMPFPQRLSMIYHGISEVIQLYKPQDAAVEELFFARNARTAMAVGQGRGIILLAASEAGLPVSEYTPMQVKQAVQGYGSATKHQVGEMVRMLLNLEAVPKPDDAADAAAIAICHIHSSRVSNMMSGR